MDVNKNISQRIYNFIKEEVSKLLRSESKTPKPIDTENKTNAPSIGQVNQALKNVFIPKEYQLGDNGFLLTDGTFVALEEGEYHDEISKYIPGLYLNEILHDFGAIRISQRGNRLVHISKEPTSSQISVLYKILGASNEPLEVGIEYPPYSINDCTMGNYINPEPKIIINHIKRFYNEGIKLKTFYDCFFGGCEPFQLDSWSGGYPTPEYYGEAIIRSTREKIAEAVHNILIENINTESSEGEGDKFKPTMEWMSKWYDIMNSELFGGILGRCKLEPFTTGRGQGNWLGRFQLLRPIRVETRSRRMFYSFWGEKTYVTKDNFATVCEPCIGLNINYSATEEGWLATLVHEMCHYYTYMYGYAPKQAHGIEFREIGERVSYNSKGRFTVQRLADAEQMKEFEMDQAMIDKKTKRTMIVVMFMCDGVVRFIPTSSEKLIDEILMIERNHGSTRCDEIRIYADPSIANEIFKIMKFKNLRSYKFYHVEDKPQVLEILNKGTYSVPYKSNGSNI